MGLRDRGDGSQAHWASEVAAEMPEVQILRPGPVYWSSNCRVGPKSVLLNIFPPIHDSDVAHPGGAKSPMGQVGKLSPTEKWVTKIIQRAEKSWQGVTHSQVCAA
jgi:hypothetical protein